MLSIPSSSRRLSMWPAKALRREGPRYLALADRIAEDVANGRLASGAQLPPQRELAARLGVDLTTISRAYREASRRGLVAGHVGRGTYVRGGLASRSVTGLGESADSVVDLSLNLPPPSATHSAATALSETLATIATSNEVSSLLGYQYSAGYESHRAAGAMWIAARGLEVSTEHVVVTSGAQHALTALLLVLLGPGDLIATESLTYPGFRALADHLRLRVIGLPLDDEGIRPDAFRDACRSGHVRVLYCTPTLHNPTTAVASTARRQQLAQIAVEFGVAIIEDDVYGSLVSDAPAPVAAAAPANSYFVASLSKAVAPGLRIGYVLAPNSREADRLSAAVRATTWMAAPLMADIASRWIQTGVAHRLLSANRAEAAARQTVARELLRGWLWRAHAEGYHGWLKLPAPWSSAEFVAQARRAGVAVAPADAFAIDGDGVGPAVRLSVSAAPDIDTLARALRRVTRLLELGPDSAAPVL